MNFFKSRLLGTTVLSALLTAACVLPARADIILSIESVTTNPGSTGTFDVLLTNTGPTVQNIDSFSFSLSTPNPDVTFSSVTTSTATAPYIFPNSLFGPDITVSASGQNILAADLDAGPTGTDVAAGATYGLGLVTFDMASTATQTEVANITVDSFPLTSLSDINGNNVTFTTTGGTVTVISGVPEPAALASTALGFGLLALTLYRRKTA